MDIFTYYRKLGAGESSPHGTEREFYSATVSSVMKRQESNSNICFQIYEDSVSLRPHMWKPADKLRFKHSDVCKYFNIQKK